jgi:uncharacterized protein YgiM (DUF1202 family)
MRRWLASLSILIVLAGVMVSAISPARAQEASATAGPGGANILAGPGDGFWQRGILHANETAPVTGVTADHQWWQVKTSRITGYVASTDVTVTGTVPVIDPGPMGTVTAGILTVRRGPGIGAARVGTLAGGQQFFLLATQENSTWIKIQSFVGVGWVNGSLTSLADMVAQNVATPAVMGTASALPMGTAAANATTVPSVAGPTAIINVASLNVHEGPGSAFNVLGTLSSGTVVPIVGRNADGSWIQVTTDFGMGWISIDLVITKNYFGNAPVVTVSVTPTPNIFMLVLTGTVNVHTGPNIAFDVITTVDAGTHLPILGTSADHRWWYVQTAAGKGWISKFTGKAFGPFETVPVIQ